ncbi:MAG: DinB family protein [Chloroflexi bacterium]|nr:DinB family protein [Chloroflexota bacterium]
MSPAWVEALEAGAPDVVACWRVFAWDLPGLKRVRRELRARVTVDGAPRIVAQQERVADALASVLDELSDAQMRAPGGEDDWNVAQAFAHTTAARRFLASWAALDAAGAPWRTAGAPLVTPSVPGPEDATREDLHRYLERSRRAISEAGERIAGHETQRCGMDHPLIGHLRCGEWLLFVGVHDCMHLEQLHALRERG